MSGDSFNPWEAEFVEEKAAKAMKLRDYQTNCLGEIKEAWKKFSRVLVVMFTGGGKTIIFSRAALSEIEVGGKVLILAHTDELLEQAIDKLRRSTGLEADKEKADSHASPYASVVVASIQTLSRTSRLTSFADNHFSLVICDETHRALAKSYQKVLNYFHFGAESLAEDWKPPSPETPYQHKARCLGVTATPSRSDRRSLGEFYQKCCFEYGLLTACQNGYSVKPIVENIPLKLDIRGVKKTGSDFDSEEVAHRITPFLGEIAKHIAERARGRKTAVFMPSVETSRLMSDCLNACAIDSSFVSGDCSDRKEKMEAFHQKGNGSAICSAMLLTEGWDHPPVSAIVPLRATKIQSLLQQIVGRGTRPLPGVIDGLETPGERLMAIASSDKKDLIVFDFLWLADSLDLVSPVDIFASTPELRKAMQATGITDLVEAEKEAQKDLLKSLENAVRKHQHKQPRTLDPISWAVSLGDPVLAAYEPDNAADAAPASLAELQYLLDRNIDTSKIKSSGQAQKFIHRLIGRDRLGLCSPKQLQFLAKLGFKEEEAALMSRGQAGIIISKKIRSWKS